MSRVREFHEAFDQPAPSHPQVPSAELASLRMRLIREEYEEVRDEMSMLLAALRTGRSPDDPTVVDIMQRVVKEICDLRYVAEGSLVAFGVEPHAYDAVHRSNMSKLGPDGKPLRRADGKAMKGPNYRPVDPEDMFPSTIEGTIEEDA